MMRALVVAAGFAGLCLWARRRRRAGAQPFGVLRGERECGPDEVKRELRKLLPHWRDVPTHQIQCVSQGHHAGAWRVTLGSEQYFVRGLAPGKDDEIISSTLALSCLNIVAPFVAASERVVVQRYVGSGQVMSLPVTPPLLKSVATLVGYLHQHAPAGLGSSAWGGVAWCRQALAFVTSTAPWSGHVPGRRTMEDAVRLLERWGRDAGERPCVCCHGDLHFFNVIVAAAPCIDGTRPAAGDDGAALLADVEFLGARPAATDLAYLFSMWGNLVVDGFPPYADLPTRTAFATAYLEARPMAGGLRQHGGIAWHRTAAVHILYAMLRQGARRAVRRRGGGRAAARRGVGVAASEPAPGVA